MKGRQGAGRETEGTRTQACRRVSTCDSAHVRTCARLHEIHECFAAEVGRNASQFQCTLRNELEFFAYMMEAFHSAEPQLEGGRSARRGSSVCFEAPAFPRTRKELLALDERLNLGIISAINEAIQVAER